MMVRACLIVVLFFLAACAKPTSSTPYSSSEEIREEEARQVQAAEQDKLRRQEVLMQEHLDMQERLVRVAIPISRAGADICRNVVMNAGMCVYDFELSKDQGINAAADGKKVKVNIAMMKFVKSDDELAIVLGHELAHNIMGHISAKQRNAYTGMMIGMVIDAVAASQGVRTGSTFSKSGAQMGGQQYSVAFEKEADYIGLYIAALAGYDIMAAPDFWRRMAVKNPDSIVISTTHPTTPERTVMIEKTINEIIGKQEQGIALVPNIAPRNAAAPVSGSTLLNPFGVYK